MNRQDVIENLLVEFSKDENYTDDIPEEMKNILCHMVEEKDWGGLTKFMQIGTDLTRRECASRASLFVLQKQAEAVGEVVEPLKIYKESIAFREFLKSVFRKFAAVARSDASENLFKETPDVLSGAIKNMDKSLSVAEKYLKEGK